MAQWCWLWLCSLTGVESWYIAPNNLAHVSFGPVNGHGPGFFWGWGGLDQGHMSLLDCDALGAVLHSLVEYCIQGNHTFVLHCQNDQCLLLFILPRHLIKIS
jgi:hypothetical protein